MRRNIAVVVAFLVFGFGFGFGAAHGLESSRAEPTVELMGRSGKALALPGRAVLLKAVLPPGRCFRYRWEFGDGCPPVEGLVTTARGLSTPHLYHPESSRPGAVYEASLTLTDVRSSESSRAPARVTFVEPTLENKTAVALDDALWALHASMQRWDDPKGGPVGCWMAESCPVGNTALTVLAFEVNGFDSRASRRDTPYRETVDRALGFLLSRCVSFPLGKGQGTGITVENRYRENYELPLVVLALVASQDPEAVATSGPAGVLGRTYREIVSDIIRFLAWGQCASRDGSRGGWHYEAGASDADMSCTQWPVLACMAARDLWGIEAPPSLARSLESGFLTHDQDCTGGFGYLRVGDRTSLGLTGAGLLGLEFVGAGAEDPRVRRALDYLAMHWTEQNVGDYYSMYAVMKAATLAEPPITKVGGHDWREDYTLALAATQNVDGTWPGDGRWGTDVRATAWPALVLSKDVFATARPMTLWERIPLGARLGAIPALLLGGVVVRLLRRHRGRWFSVLRRFRLRAPLAAHGAGHGPLAERGDHGHEGRGHHEPEGRAHHEHEGRGHEARGRPAHEAHHQAPEGRGSAEPERPRPAPGGHGRPGPRHR